MSSATQSHPTLLVYRGTIQEIVSAQDAALSPSAAASRAQRVAKALEALAKEKENPAVVQKIQQDIDFLVLHEATLAELSK